MMLNLGCGSQIAPGWVNIDRVIQHEMLATPGDPLPEVATFDLRSTWPYGHGTAEAAVCHHVFDLMTATETIYVLAEARRVIAPEGHLRVSLFDPRKAAEAASRHDEEWFTSRWAGGEQGHPQLGIDYWLRKALTCGGARQQVLTPTSFGPMAYAAGWEKATVDHFRGSSSYEPFMPWSHLDTRQAESWFMELA